MAETKYGPRRVLARERQRQAIELRIAGASFAVIATQLGYATAYGAYMAIDAGLKHSIQPPADALRELDTQRLERLLLSVWPQALKGDLGAIDRALKILAQRARLLGLELAPTTSVDFQGVVEHVFRIVTDAPPELRTIEAAALLPGDGKTTSLAARNNE